MAIETAEFLATKLAETYQITLATNTDPLAAGSVELRLQALNLHTPKSKPFACRLRSLIHTINYGARYKFEEEQSKSARMQAQYIAEPAGSTLFWETLNGMAACNNPKDRKDVAVVTVAAFHIIIGLRQEENYPGLNNLTASFIFKSVLNGNLILPIKRSSTLTPQSP